MSTAPNIEAETQRRKTALLFRNVTYAQSVHIVNASLLAYVNATLHASAKAAFAWWCAVVVVAVGRFLLARRFFAAAPDASAALAWRRRYLQTILLAGLVWAAGTVLFMWNAPEGPRLFTALVLAGMVAGAVPILAPVLIAFRTFAVLLCLPVAIVVLLQAHLALDWAFGGVTLVFLAAMFTGARHLHDSLDVSIRLSLEQSQLADKMERAHHAAETALTERKEIEESLRDERDFAEKLIDTAPTIVLLLDPEGRIVRFNHYLEKLCGYRLEEVKGTDWFSTFLLDTEAESLHKLFGRAISDARTQGNINTIVAKDGRKIRVEWYDRALKDSAGNVTGLLAVGLDVTQRERMAESQRLLMAAVEQSSSTIVVTDAKGDIEFVNDAFSQTTGYSPEEVIGQNPRIIKSGEIPQETYQELWATITQGGHWHGELANRKKNGELFWEMANISPVADASGRITHFLAVKDDITQRKQAEAEVDRLSQWNELLLNSAGEGIYGVDREGRCTFINPTALDMLGFDKAEILGARPHAIFHHHMKGATHYPEADCPILLTLHDGITRKLEDTFIRKNGEDFPAQLTVTPMHENAKLVGAVIVFQDIAQRKAMEQELKRLAVTDPLTGVANRRHFLEALENELERTLRYGQPAALLMVDIDHFKQVNDTHGHAIGDAVLRHFTELTRLRLRRVDHFGRLGGEEFAILLPDTDQAAALRFAENFRLHVVDTPFQGDKGTIGFTISIGLTEFEPGDTKPDSVLARADEALYRAKAGGRNRVELSRSTQGVFTLNSRPDRQPI